MGIGIIIGLAAIVGVQAIWIIILRSERKHRTSGEASLKQERAMLYGLMDNLHEAVFFKDRSSNFIRTNSFGARLHGFGKPEEVIGKNDFDIHSASLAEIYYREEQRMMETGEPIIDRETRGTTAEGEDQWLRYSKIPVTGVDGEVIGLFGIAQDITAEKKTAEAIRQYQENLEREVRKRTEELAETNTALREQLSRVQAAEQRTQQALEERNILLREIHHRVKNNLQTIASLIYLQIENSGDPEGSGYLSETLGRIKSMSLVHEMLYQEQSFTSIGLNDFLRGIVSTIPDTSQLEGIDYSLTGDVDLRINIDIAIPFALMLYEILTVMISGLADRTGKRKLSMSVTQEEQGTFGVQIADNNPEQAELAGLSEELVTILVDQVGGTLSQSHESGNIWLLSRIRCLQEEER